MRELVASDAVTVEALAARLKQAKSIAEFQRIQCVLMRAALDCSASEIAQVLGWATATVHITHSRWAKEGESFFELKGKGGRRSQNLTEQEQSEFWSLAKKSKGRPSALPQRDRARMKNIVGKAIRGG